MKRNPPKISIIRLILTVTLTACIIIYTATKLIKNKPITTNPVIPPSEETLPPMPAVKHPAHTFKNADIVTVMEKIKEWYNVQYAYRKPINNRFTGTIPADISIDEALKLLEKMSPPIKFLRIDTMQIVVNPL